MNKKDRLIRLGEFLIKHNCNVCPISLFCHKETLELPSENFNTGFCEMMMEK